MHFVKRTIWFATLCCCLTQFTVSLADNVEELEYTPRHLTNDHDALKGIGRRNGRVQLEQQLQGSQHSTESYSDIESKEADDEESSEYYDDSEESTSESSSGSIESVPRLLSQSAFNRISETLGALNTVGHLLVDMTRGGGPSPKPHSNATTAIVHSTTTTSATTAKRGLDTVHTTPAVINTDPNKGLLGKNTTIVPVIDKRVDKDDNVEKPLFVETKEIKKKKKKKNKNKNKVKKPMIDVPSNSSSIQQPTTLRPTTTTSYESNIRPVEQIASEDVTPKDVENRCKTPSGRPGRCEDLSSCPALLLNLSSLRESLCFKSLFVPGVCCPITETTVITTTQRPLKLTTKPPSSTTSTTRRPITTRPTPNLVLIPQIKPSTTTTTTQNPLDSISNEVTGVTNNNIIDPEECGQQEYSSGRIVGGIEAPNGQWPWMAAIFLHGPKRTEFWCGGSLIGAKYILTAAHCTRDSRQKPFAARQFTVRLGDIDLSTDAEPSAPVTFAVKEVRAHERFSRIGFYNDIAILVLDKPVRKSKYVIPVCLPREGRMPPKERLPGRRATVVGWGTTYYGGKESTTQRQAELPVWRNEDCDRSYFQPINENFICAGYSDGGVDACQGDSGGPLMMRYESRWVQLGVVSFGNKCGEPGYPGVYTRVSQYLDWIKDHTKD